MKIKLKYLLHNSLKIQTLYCHITERVSEEMKGMGENTGWRVPINPVIIIYEAHSSVIHTLL